MIAWRLFFCCAVGCTAGILLAVTSWAETWSDSTGKFRVEAEYVGVEGTNVVLRKEDGETLRVPISRLSEESRALAKSLYDQNKSAGAVPATPSAPAMPAKSPPTESNAAPATAAARTLSFAPPQPPSIPPLAPFPENPSLQETVDFVKAQLLAGHPEVFWYAVPTEIRQTIDSDEFRNKLNPFMAEQAAANQQIKGVVLKAIEVLVTKKEFMLNSPVMGQVPPPLVPTVQEAYDPAVGLIYELSMLSFDNLSLADRSISQLLDDHGPRIGAHVQALAKLAPPGTIDMYLGQVVVDETSDSTGTITVPNNKGGTEATEMVKLSGRWVPKDFAEGWESNKEGLTDQIIEGLNQAKQQREAAGQDPAAMVGMIAMMANGVIDPMLAATTQAEFDQAVMRILAMLPNPGGNVDPGGTDVQPNLELE